MAPITAGLTVIRWTATRENNPSFALLANLPARFQVLYHHLAVSGQPTGKHHRLPLRCRLPVLLARLSLSPSPLSPPAQAPLSRVTTIIASIGQSGNSLEFYL